jgi:uncharacterized protein YcbK (DUF882 family)
MSIITTRRQTLLGLGAAILTPSVAAAAPTSYLEALAQFAQQHPDELRKIERDLDPEAAADLLSIPTGRVQIGTPKDYDAIAAGNLVMYNTPRRAGQATDRLVLGIPKTGNLSKFQMEQVNYLYRDMRNDEEYWVDPMQVKMLGQVSKKLGVPLKGTSLLRSPSTQALLIARSKEANGGISKVAINSFHSTQREFVMAADLQCELGVAALWRAVRAVCAKHGIGGHSRYSNFVHMDSGPLRTW